MTTSQHRLTIQWGDCDPAGIVYYPRYLAMFDDSTVAMFRNVLGLTKPEMQKRFGIVGYPMVDTHTKFFVPSTFGDEVVIETRITAFHRSSFELHHRLLRDGNVLAVEGFDKRVWVGRHPDDPARIKGREIPQEVIERFNEVQNG